MEKLIEQAMVYFEYKGNYNLNVDDRMIIGETGKGIEAIHNNSGM